MMPATISELFGPENDYYNGAVLTAWSLGE